ncbi:MAG: xanthine dehydrogenase family protein molybdopterin-binding subunit [Myxococcota bacterium]
MSKVLQNENLSRRLFITGSAAAGAGLVIGFNIGCGGKAPAPVPTPPAGAGAAQAASEFTANAFVRIGPDSSVTVISKHIEFGQGTYTGLATILADELGADWKQVKVESAPANAEVYGNPAFGGAQGTGGSTAMAVSWLPMRQAGAKARAMLIQAAAQEWSVPADELDTRMGQVVHAGSGKSAPFGQLVTRAATLSPPEEVKLKDPSQFSLIGKPRLRRLDLVEKSNGEAIFTQDIHLPGMLTAVLARPPRFGGKVKSFDDSSARRIKGVVAVVQVPRGVAVVAESFWTAKKGRDALRVEWDDSEAEKRGSAELWAEYRSMIAKPGRSVRDDGEVAKALSGASKVIEADFEFPFLAHAPMETEDCVVQLKGGACEIWAGSQIQTADQAIAAQLLGVTPDKVRINTLLGGGSFGRRGTPNADVIVEALTVAMTMKTDRPIKVVWTREDDIQGGFYRPMVLHRMRGGLDKAGNIVAWHHAMVGQSIMTGTMFEVAMQNGIDPTLIEGAANLPYSIANLKVEFQYGQIGVPVLWWRAVGHTQNAFSTEVFLDQLAAAAGKDPYQVRRSLLAKHPRHLAVLDLAAQKSGWGSPMPRGKARGIAVHESFGSFVAEVAEISLDSQGLPVVERVVCAVDCGIAINPDTIAAQMEGGLGFGLGAVMMNEITLDRGLIEQSNFHDYRSLRIHQMPRVEVHIAPSQEAPSGVGEPGLPPIAPAVANAYLKLTGTPIHRLPFTHLKETGGKTR